MASGDVTNAAKEQDDDERGEERAMDAWRREEEECQAWQLWRPRPGEWYQAVPAPATVRCIEYTEPPGPGSAGTQVGSLRPGAIFGPVHDVQQYDGFATVRVPSAYIPDMLVWINVSRKGCGGMLKASGGGMQRRKGVRFAQKFALGSSGPKMSMAAGQMTPGSRGVQVARISCPGGKTELQAGGRTELQGHLLQRKSGAAPRCPGSHR